MAIDDGTAVHYSALERGTPVYDSEEVRVGTVREVLDNYREHIFDGIVIEDEGGRCDSWTRPRWRARPSGA